MAGSYYLEELCDEIEDGVWKYLKKIEKMGGSIKGIERGFFQSEIQQNAYRLKKEIDNNSRVIVGVNKFSEIEPTKQELLRIDDTVEIQQRKALKKLRSTRDNNKVEHALSKMQSIAESEENLMPYILDSVKVYATTGEISNTFREVFGEYRPKEVF
jgi:methylmalonyl-CoA mutase N-terminal domain/subunit